FVEAVRLAGVAVEKSGAVDFLGHGCLRLDQREGIQSQRNSSSLDMRLGLTPVNLHPTGGRQWTRAKFLLWLNTAVKLSVLRLDCEVEALAASRLFGEEMPVRPEDTLRAAGISSERQAKYQRQMSNLLAGRSWWGLARFSYSP